MSWQAYVDTNLVGTGKVSKGAIYGHNGQLWAVSKGFNVREVTQITDAEVQTMLNAFKDASTIRQNGIYIGGVKFFALKADDRSVYGKQGTGGLICVKTKQAVLVATYQEPTQFGEATKVVEGLADYLISVNY